MSRMPNLKKPTSKAVDSGARGLSSDLTGPSGFPYGVKKASTEHEAARLSPYPALIDVDAMISEADISLVLFIIFLP